MVNTEKMSALLKTTNFLNITRKSTSTTEPSTEFKPNFIGAGKIDFKAAGLPEYQNCYAIVLDDLFTREELSRFLATAEASSEWDVARVNATANLAYIDTNYRNGERIILDDHVLSAEIFAKIRPRLAEIEEIEDEQWTSGGWVKFKMRMVGMNERLRFLRYQPGGFFRKHIDGCYITPDGLQRTHFTVQLYLPSSTDGSDESFAPAEGGSTRFLKNRGNWVDVEAIPGRVLIFQHEKLLHTGEEVISGVKCAVRCDILYERLDGVAEDAS